MVALSIYIFMWSAVLLAIVKQPRWGLYFLIPLLPLQIIRYRVLIYPLGNTFIDLILLGVLIGMIMRKQGPLFESTVMSRILKVFCVFHYLSLWYGSFAQGYDAPLWFNDMRMSVFKNYMVMFLLFVLVYNCFKTEKEMKILMVLMVLSTFMVSFTFARHMRGRNTTQFSYEVRDAGPMGYAGVNGFAAFEAQFSLFFLGFTSLYKRWWVKLGIYLMLALNMYSLLFSFSRGAYVGFVIGLVFIGILQERKFLVLLAALAFIWSTVLPPAVIDRITGTYQGGVLESSAEERVQLWEDAVARIKSSPIIGAGFYTYALSREGESLRDTHNYYLKVMVETGIVGLLLFVALLVKMFSVSFGVYRNAKSDFLRAMAFGFCACMISVFIVNIFGDRWTYIQVNAFLWTLLAMITRAYKIEVESPKPKEEPAPPGMPELAVAM